MKSVILAVASVDVQLRKPPEWEGTLVPQVEGEGRSVVRLRFACTPSFPANTQSGLALMLRLDSNDSFEVPTSSFTVQTPCGHQDGGDVL
jgi:hypothetical protein